MTASSSPPTPMSHFEYSASNVNAPYAHTSVPLTTTHHALSPVHCERLSSPTLSESHLSPAVTYSHFVPTPTQELLMRRQQVHSWPLDIRSSRSLPHQRHNNYHSDLSSPTNSLPPYHARHIPKHRHQHSQSLASQPLVPVRGTSVPWTLAGSLDPSTGIFYRTPENPRLRTAQACEKCRTRKAKCSGEHPTCNRCLTRGLICEYSKEGRLRGSNRPKIRDHGNPESDGPINAGKGPGTTLVGSASPAATAYLAASNYSTSKTHTPTLSGNDQEKGQRRPLFLTVPHPSSASLPPPPSRVLANSSLARRVLDETAVGGTGSPGAPLPSPHTIDISGEFFDRATRHLYSVPSLSASFKSGHGEAEATQNEFIAYGRALGVEFGSVGSQQNPDATRHRMLEYPPDNDMSPLHPNVHSNPFSTGFGTHVRPCTNASQLSLDSASAFRHTRQDANAMFRSGPQYLRHDGGHEYHLHECEGVLIDAEAWPQQGMDVGLQLGFEQHCAASTAPEDRPAVGWTRTDAHGETFER